MRVYFRHDGNDFNRAAFEQLTSGRPGTPGGELLDRYGERVEVRAKFLVGVDTRAILNSIHRERGPGYVDVVAGVPGVTDYLGYHHFGYGPYTIRPRTRRALRFVSGGQVVFATRVRHPGFAGTLFLTNALRSIAR